MKFQFHALILLSALAFVACGDDKGSTKPSVDSETKVDCGAPTSCEPAGGAEIEVTCPAGGETVQPGDTVVLRWRARVTDFTGFVPQISLNNGQSYTELVSESILAEAAPEFQCFSYEVVIEDAWKSAGNQAILRVKDYSSKATMRDAAPNITIQGE